MPALTTANLVAYVLQIAAIVAIGAGLPLILRLTSPRARLFYWRALLIVCLVLPLIQPLTPAPAAVPTAVTSFDLEATATTAPGPAAVAPLPDHARLLPSSVGQIVAAIVLLGMVARFTWLGMGLVMLRRLRRFAVRLVPRPPAVDEACLLTGANAEFRVAPTVTRPVTFGVLRPVVVVPGDYTTFDERQQIAVACHELVHVRRRDWLRTIADEVVRSAFWFHPALWWLLDQIHLTAEQVVDQEVVAITGARQPYLEALVRLAAPVPRMSLRPASLFIRRSHLRERVTLLLKEVSMSRPRLVVSFVTMAVALMVSGRLVVSAFPLQGTVVVRPVQPAQVLQPIAAAQPAREAQPAVQSQAPQATKPQGSQRPGEPVPQPAKPPVAGGGSTKIHDVRPVYPPEAAAAGVSGPVILTLTIDSTGQVADAKVVKGDVTLAPAALEAVRQWRYQPPATAPVVATVAVNVVDSQQVDATPQPVRVGGSVKAPVKIKDVKPVYPEVAQNARVQGVVIAEAKIDSSGIVSDARILRSIPLLDAAALDALMQWKFVPPLMNGVPVPVIMTVTVNFRLDSTPKTEGVEGGVAGGVVGGVAGGVQGGVAGGVVGGVPGGTGRGAGTGVGAGVAALDAEREVARARQAAGAGAAGEAPVRVGSGIAAPKKTKDVRPVYPEVARAAKVQGVVIAEILIRPDGTVQDAKILRSIPLLDQAALDAVMQWEFTPTLMNGEAVPIVMTVTVNFTLAK